MKTLKFTPELCDLILAGEKTATWRLFDDKDLASGDKVEFLNNQTLEVIGVATLLRVCEKPIKELTDEDKQGHESYESEQAMLEAFTKLYQQPITADHNLKIIHFSFEPVATT